MRESGKRATTGELAPTAEIPSEGKIRVRVRYCECDPMGVAHHSACIPWFEMGRTELLRTSGITYADMEAAGVFLVVTRIETRYHAPARYDDDLILITRVTGGGRARIDHAYELYRFDPEPPAGRGRGRTDLLCTATSTLACVDATGRPRPLPAWLRPAAHHPPG